MTSDKIFFTSDTHFGHRNIISYCNRPFSGVEEMDREMTARWNEIVPEDGLVFHLGDFAFLGAGRYRGLLSTNLKGREKYLILGNHDPRTLKKDAWTGIYQEHTLILPGLPPIHLSHYPPGGEVNPGEIYLHGHLHSKSPWKENPWIIDVGVDGHNYKPWTLEEIMGRYKKEKDS